jgi:glucosamine--fructose-6-phosphate aminotransferase (isomerizing)
VPDAVSEQIDRSLESAAGFDRYRDVESGSVIARGVNYGTAFEIALKIRELSGVPVRGVLLRGSAPRPDRRAEAGAPAIVIAPSGRTLASLREAVDKVRERGADVCRDQRRRDFLASARRPSPLDPDVPEWLSPLVTVDPGQVAAVQLAKLRGADVDSPTGLTKITAHALAPETPQGFDVEVVDPDVARSAP